VSPRGRRVTASQVGQYAFCARAWWLGVVEGLEPTNPEALAEGTAAHERHGWRVSVARGFSQIAFLLLGAALFALAIGVIRWLR
jgi:CRISPR/Cas system-associated exonuclease Cas4 (RecB family)